jgi:hypothetical protein
MTSPVTGLLGRKYVSHHFTKCEKNQQVYQTNQVDPEKAAFCQQYSRYSLVGYHQTVKKA